MAVDRRLVGFSGFRFDIPFLRSIESAVSFDFDMLTRGMFTGINQPYLLSGFDIIIPNAAINASELQVTVAGSCLLHATASQSGTILQVPTTAPVDTLSPSSSNVIGSFQAGTLNYVGLDYTRNTDPSTVDNVAGWSPSQQLEFQRTTAIGNILNYSYVISTNGFSTFLPLWIVNVSNTGAVVWITKAVTDFWREGTGGASPNPFNRFNWGGLTNTQAGANPRREWISTIPGTNPLTVAPGSDPNAFFYGDFTIKTLKNLIDAVQTRFCEITNSQYWYFDSNVPGGGGQGLNLYDTNWDSIGSVMTGAGNISYNLILQSSLPTYGVYQSTATDSTALPGDCYVQGQTSFTDATLTAFNGGTLIINSLTSGAFVFNEALVERRLFRPFANQWTMYAFVDDAFTWAALQRVSALSPSPANNISSWSFVTNDSSTGGAQAAWSLVTVNTSTAHGLNPGQWVNVSGLTGTALPPNGVYRIVQTPSTTSFVYDTVVPQTGSPTVAGTNNASQDSNTRQPYNPSLPITAFAPGTGTQGLLTVPNHNFLAPVSLTGNFTITSNQITSVSSTSSIYLGGKVVSSNFSAGYAYIVGISGSTVTVSAPSTANATAAVFDVNQQILVQGLQASSFTSQQLDGYYDIQGLTLSNQIIISLGSAVTGTSVAAGAAADLLYFTINQLSVTEAVPAAYDVVNITAFAVANDQVQFQIGSSSLPSVPIASGSFQFDGVVATSTVLDPVRVSTITNDGVGNLTVTTFVPHHLVTGGPQSFTIYGNSSLSQYIRSYANVTIVVTGSDTFMIENTGIVSGASYTNSGGNDNTFVRFANNPYPGPVQWSSDIVVKGIIGDLSVTVPQTAVVDTSDPNIDPAANQFNINGTTGTAYLQDGEVLYVILERNRPVSNSTIFSTAGAGSTIATSSIMTDAEGNPLVVGDFLKFSGEADNYWLKIATINSSAVTLVTDRGQPPTINQRPAATGPMLYCKGSRPLVKVKLHDLVDATPDSYWLAVRRDNGSSTAKVYFRNLELSPGEVRPITDGISNNLLVYTGAMTEGAVNPNYTIAQASGPFQYTQNLTIGAVDNLTQMVSFTASPSNPPQKGDQIRYYDGTNYHYFTIQYVLTNLSVVLEQPTNVLAASQTVTYFQEDQFIEDTDNLTLALRKEDRQAGQVNTALTRPVYDESVFVQEITLGGSGTVRSGSYMYTGTITNPTALAWVLHGNAPVTETIEGNPVVMPGDNPSVGSSAILVNIVFGTFSDGAGIFQNGASTGRTVNNPSNPPFPAPPIYGDSLGGGVELVLPPNRRTQVSSGGGIVVYGNQSTYSRDAISTIGGDELLVIVNDGVREANVDYSETFGGPKAKIQLIRYCPPDTRMRFRNLATYGVAAASASSNVSLQGAYNAGSSIQIAPGVPVTITSDNVPAGNAAMIVNGSLLINGGSSALGGIFNATGDQNFQVGKESNKPQNVWSGFSQVKTHSDHPLSQTQRFTASQISTGASGTIATGATLTLNNNYNYRISVKATAYRSDGPLGMAALGIEGDFYCLSGTAAAGGSPISEVYGTAGDGISYAMVFAVSGNQVMPVVYGTSGSTVQWVFTIEVQGVSTP